MGIAAPSIPNLPPVHLKRRIPDKETLRREVLAWADEWNQKIVAGMFGALFAGPHLERAGYGWTVGRLMPNLLLLAALLILQARVIPSRFRSALNLHPKEPAHKRDAPS